MLKPITIVHQSNGTVWTPREGYFADSETGRIWSEKTHRWLAEATLPNGYKRVGLYVDEQKMQKQFLVHRLVWIAHNGQIAKGFEINHINECKADNRLCNLELLTRKENINFGTRNERAAKARSNEVYQYDIQGNLVAVWPSVRECGRNGFHQGHVSACCRGEQKTHKGFRWSYEPYV